MEKIVINEETYNVSNLGCSKVSENKNGIEISNLDNSGINGIAISGLSENVHHVFGLKSLQIGKDQALNVSHFAMDRLGRQKCIFQQSFAYDDEKKRVRIAINSRLLPDRYSIVGERNGKEVYRAEHITPRNQPEVNWIWIAVAAAVYVLDNISASRKVETGPDGTTTTTEIDWGSTKDGGTNTYVTNKGNQIEADRIYIETVDTASSCVPRLHHSQIQLTGYNLDPFVLKSSRHSQ